MSRLSRIQEDVWTVTSSYGPLTVADVAYHLNIEESRARSVLNQLEARGLVGRNYTSKRRVGTRFSYEATGVPEGFIKY